MATTTTTPTTLLTSTASNPSNSVTDNLIPDISPSPGPNNSSPPLSPLPPDYDSDAADDKNTSLLNYYYVFLALFVILLGVGVWGLHRRRSAKKRRSQNRRQNALARDVDGFLPIHRRWVPGNLASRIDRHNRFGTRALERDADEEGLNEFGEAPPPYLPPAYKAKANETGGDGGQSAAAAASSGLGGAMPAVPLRTLSRGAVGKPPGYEETIHTPTTPTAPTTPEASVLPSASSNTEERR